ARRVADVTGLYVTPGLIDIHAHLYNRPGYPFPKRNQSVQPDSVSFRSGVTTMVDAGTSGWRDFPDFLRGTIQRSQTRVLAFLNIVAAGMGMGNEHDAHQHDADAAAKMAREHSDVIVGFKTAHYEGPGWVSIDSVLKAGRQVNLPVMVDFGKLIDGRNIRTLLLDKLRPGDIYTHCYSGLRGEFVDGKVSPVMIEARRRGIIMDVGHGGGSFFWNIALPMVQQKFYPDSISTDMHFGSINGGMKDILNVASKLLVLGVPFDQVVRMLTVNPANEIRRPQLGNLDVGAEADVAVLRIEQGQFGFLDSAGARYTGRQRVTCEMTLRAGKVVWDLNARAALDWARFDYTRRNRP
ncbi:MAG: amidohydrolase/deacetylase family metallohydrolase, partial [Bryobacterales bacterium]|nr:amidohydrolase/deacetylase family metallohydrolase [Bryobacterales bacterium]